MSATGKSAAQSHAVTGRTPALSLVVLGQSATPSGYTDVLAVDTGDTLNAETGLDLQVDAGPGGGLVFIGKTSAEVDMTRFASLLAILALASCQPAFAASIPLKSSPRAERRRAPT